MRLIDRLKNLWALSAYHVEGEYIVPGIKGQVPKLVNASKPKARPAVIVETKDPVDPLTL
jgi:hypothetical protein